MSLVLVTGGSGFVAQHCVLQLLAAGHDVRTTVRNPAREAEVRALLKKAGADDGRLSFAAADLTRDAGWPEAVAGADFVLHVASPFPPSVPKNEDDLIIPARDGALRVLKSARAAGVKRVVLTSSFAAVGYGHPDRPTPFDERDWTDLSSPEVQPYVKSKTLAERAAWDFAAKEPGFELAVVNPVAVLGPVPGPDTSTSIMFVKRLLDGSMPGLPRISFGLVDVRDVADLHLRAMTDPRAAGERFIAVAGDFMAFKDMARTLKSRLGPAASRVPTRELPDWILRFAGFFSAEAKQVLPELGKHKNATSEKARRALAWAPRSREDALVATAESLFELGLLKRKRGA